ncbi:unnamed protein product, partial [Brenthis ino]
MSSLAVLFLLKFSTFHSVLSEATYECGEHGRFEYCIDEIPGCVIGCHCHPGYYFDTDSKICEPNSKLIEHHKRLNIGELTRVQDIAATPSLLSETDSTFTSKLDTHVDEISKDANDLGDWLYNQFFKTIENQVINKTGNNDIPSRRSGAQSLITKPKRRNKWKRDRKRKQKGRKNMKKKLLRITEDDSMFDMNSHSSSDSSDSSTSDSSFEHDRHSSDDEHGHKKIVMVNKKPKPQLPSFIFLPNLDTPFYPPIGLPPPPVVPMYPIVPVPPVIPIGVDCTTESTNTKTTTSPTTISEVTTKVVTAKPTTEIPPKQESSKKTEDPTTPNPNRQFTNKRKKKISRIQNNYDENKIGLGSPHSGNRQKILARLKDRMNHRPSAKLLMSPWENNNKLMMDTYIRNKNIKSPDVNNAMYDDSILANQMQAKPMQGMEPPENVDFKYITELIHRVDLKNKSNYLPPIEYNPLDSQEVYKPQRIQQHTLSDYVVPPNTPDGRRYLRPSNQQSNDDLYYTKLGRDIASMIRGIDAQNRHVNIQLEATRNTPQSDLYFNENSPRSYWERSVRSPLRLLETNKNKFEYLKSSNEILFDIENKVEIVASTVPTMSLQEIENIVSVIEAARKNIKKKETSIRNLIPNTNNLNINLWPQGKLSNNNVPSPNQQNHETNKNKIVKQKNDIPPGTHGIQMHNIHRFVAWQKPSKDMTHKNQFSNTNVKIKPDATSPLHLQKNYNRNSPYETKQVKLIPHPNNNSRQSLLGYDMNSLFLKHRKYFNDDDDNFYINQPSLYSKGTQPSYFHQEINHFDYFK